MKIEHRIPTTQFGYITVYIEPGEVLEPDVERTIVDDHARLIWAYNAPQSELGIPEKEMNMVIDAMLAGESVKDGVEIYNRMSESQKQTVQCLKRGLKRIKRKNGMEEETE